MENSGRFHARRCNLEIVVTNLRENFMVAHPIGPSRRILMGAKDSMLEFAREPAGGGYDRAWCFPVQCMVVARLPRVYPTGECSPCCLEEAPQRA